MSLCMGFEISKTDAVLSWFTLCLLCADQDVSSTDLTVSSCLSACCHASHHDDHGLALSGTMSPNKLYISLVIVSPHNSRKVSNTQFGARNWGVAVKDLTML